MDSKSLVKIADKVQEILKKDANKENSIPVYCVDNWPGIMQMVNAHPDFRTTNIFSEAEVIIFPGGADVNPAMYGEKYVHPKTSFDIRTDARHRSLWGHKKSVKYLKIGICRGAQFLNVANGGTLWQDVNNHGLSTSHEIFYWTGKDYVKAYVTSTHHQMMRPNWSDAELWGFCYRSTHRDTGCDFNRPTNFMDEGPDPEIVWYPKTNTLCFQGHPEYGSKACTDIFWKSVERTIIPFSPGLD